jgi:hypothetical protein
MPPPTTLFGDFSCKKKKKKKKIDRSRATGGDRYPPQRLGGQRSGHPHWPFLSLVNPKKKKKKDPATRGGRDPPPAA